MAASRTSIDPCAIHTPQQARATLHQVVVQSHVYHSAKSRSPRPNNSKFFKSKKQIPKHNKHAAKYRQQKETNLQSSDTLHGDAILALQLVSSLLLAVSDNSEAECHSRMSIVLRPWFSLIVIILL